MMDIKAVIFDMGRVLVAIDNRRLIDLFFPGMDASNSHDVAKRTITDPSMVEFNSGRIDEQEFYQRMRHRYGLNIGFEEFCRLWSNMFYPMDGMEELVESLRGRVRLGLLSDTDPLHWEFLRTTYPWIDEFETKTLSCQLGVMKPNPAIYIAAANSLDTPPEQCLYIDDLEDNCGGARNTGMTAICFENVGQLKDSFKQFRLL